MDATTNPAFEGLQDSFFNLTGGSSPVDGPPGALQPAWTSRSQASAVRDSFFGWEIQSRRPGADCPEGPSLRTSQFGPPVPLSDSAYNRTAVPPRDSTATAFKVAELDPWINKKYGDMCASSVGQPHPCDVPDPGAAAHHQSIVPHPATPPAAAHHPLAYHPHYPRPLPHPYPPPSYSYRSGHFHRRPAVSAPPPYHHPARVSPMPACTAPRVAPYPARYHGLLPSPLPHPHHLPPLPHPYPYGFRAGQPHPYASSRFAPEAADVPSPYRASTASQPYAAAVAAMGVSKTTAVSGGFGVLQQLQLRTPAPTGGVLAVPHPAVLADEAAPVTPNACGTDQRVRSMSPYQPPQLLLPLQAHCLPQQGRRLSEGCRNGQPRTQQQQQQHQHPGEGEPDCCLDDEELGRMLLLSDGEDDHDWCALGAGMGVQAPGPAGGEGWLPGGGGAAAFGTGVFAYGGHGEPMADSQQLQQGGSLGAQSRGSGRGSSGVEQIAAMATAVTTGMPAALATTPEPDSSWVQLGGTSSGSMDSGAAAAAGARHPTPSSWPCAIGGYPCDAAVDLAPGAWHGGAGRGLLATAGGTACPLRSLPLSTPPLPPPPAEAITIGTKRRGDDLGTGARSSKRVSPRPWGAAAGLGTPVEGASNNGMLSTGGAQGASGSGDISGSGSGDEGCTGQEQQQGLGLGLGLGQPSGPLPGPVRVVVSGMRPAEDDERETIPVTTYGTFYPDLYLQGEACIRVGAGEDGGGDQDEAGGQDHGQSQGQLVTRSCFEKIGYSPQAKWYRSIRVVLGSGDKDSDGDGVPDPVKFRKTHGQGRVQQQTAKGQQQQRRQQQDDEVPLGRWLESHGLPVLKGRPRRIVAQQLGGRPGKRRCT